MANLKKKSKKIKPRKIKQSKLEVSQLPAIASKQLRRRRERDSAYREALGIEAGGELPNQIGNTVSAGGGRDRRRNLGSTKKDRGGNSPSRIRLIG